MSAQERRRLASIQAKLERREFDVDAARREWAATVRAIGISAVAAELGWSRQRVSKTVKRYEEG